MDTLQHLSEIVAVTLGAAWASGINLYAAILVLGGAGAMGHMSLPAGLEVLGHPAVLGAAGLMYIVEFFADKIPGFDSVWDAIHTFIRIPAGALIAAGSVGSMDPGWVLAASLVGGALTTGTHVAKAGSRLVINTSPEPFSNWAASVSEDVGVVMGLWLAIRHPAVFLLVLLGFILLLAWLLPKLWRGVRKIRSGIYRLFRRNTAP